MVLSFVISLSLFRLSLSLSLSSSVQYMHARSSFAFSQSKPPLAISVPLPFSFSLLSIPRIEQAGQVALFASSNEYNGWFLRCANICPSFRGSRAANQPEIVRALLVKGVFPHRHTSTHAEFFGEISTGCL